MHDREPNSDAALLAGDEEGAVLVEHEGGGSPLLLICDHAGRALPRRLGRLGLAEAEFERHIAWDIGILAVSRGIASRLDAFLIGQRYSRLVIDCNRPIAVASSIPEISESTAIPGNMGLSDNDRQQRRSAIFDPYHAAIAAEIDRRVAGDRPPILVAMHSFTPIFMGQRRPWHIGTLYGEDRRLARTLHSLLVDERNLVVGDNEPYAVSVGSDYTIPTHGVGRGLMHVGIEIRQDLIADEEGQEEWAGLLARLLPKAAEQAAR